MKSKTSASRVPFISPPCIHGKVTNRIPSLEKPPVKKTKTEVETILRWEDDGGQMLEADRPVDPSNPNKATKRADK
jgi:hypothetical protein